MNAGGLMRYILACIIIALILVSAVYSRVIGAGVKSVNGTTQNVTSNSTTWTVQNNNGKDVFVPNATQAEFDAFRAKAPALNVIVTQAYSCTWDVSVVFYNARWNNFYPFGSAPGALGSVYYALLSSDDNTYTNIYGSANCCYSCNPYWYNRYASENAARPAGWFVERKRVSATEYHILIRGVSRQDCTQSGPGYVKGELGVNDQCGWHIDSVNSQSVEGSSFGQPTYFVRNAKSIQFAAGNACGGCCACADPASISIDITLKRG